MNKLISIFFVALSSLPLYQEEENTFTYYVPKTIQGMKYGVYLDEECKIPLFDENNEDYVITVDLNQDGKIELQQEHVYLKQIETVDGYYLDHAVYDMTLDNNYAIYPISIFYESEIYPANFQLYKDDEMIAEWKAEKKSEACYQDEKIVYQAGETYTLHQNTNEDYMYVDDITFTLPLGVDKGYESKTIIEMKKNEYGCVDLALKDSKGQLVEGGEYQLCTDVKGLEIAKDINGKDARKKSDSEGKISWNLLEGTYYLKQINIPDDYYCEMDVRKIEVKKSETKNIEISPNWIETKILIEDVDEGNLLTGTIQVGDITINSGESIHLKRDVSYEMISKNHPSGYFEPKPLTITIPTTKEFEDIKLKTHAFSVSIGIQDIDTKEMISDVKYRILNHGKIEKTFTSSNEELFFSDLKSGEIYSLEEISTVDGYCESKSVSFEIPSYSEEKSIINVVVNKIPYVYLSGSVIDDSNRSVEGNMILYEDASCTKVANDINGNQIIDIKDQTLKIRNGTYYAKLKNIDSHFYDTEEVMKIDLNHASSLKKQVEMKVSNIIAEVKIIDEDLVPLEKYTYTVNDEKGNVIILDCNENKLEDLLEKNKKYYVSLTNVDGNYTYAKAPMELNIPSSKPEINPTVTIQCNSFMTLKIQQDEMYGNTYGLFLDENCETLAKDIKGRFTKAKIDDDASWQLRKGTYYLKEIENTSTCYPNMSIEKIVLTPKKWEVIKNISLRKVKLNISFKDESGEFVDDGVYEVLDSKGNILDEFTGSQNEFYADYLYPASTYTIHEKKAPHGYLSNSIDIVYTTPSVEPFKIPNIEIIYEKKEEVIPEMFSNEKEKDEGKSINLITYIGILAVLLCVFIAVVKIFKKK